MVKIRKEFVIGFLVLMGALIVFWGLNFLKGEDILSQRRTMYAMYDNVGGLLKTNPVMINGLQVGQVRDLYFSEDGSNRITVEFFIENPIPIPANSIAHIYSSDLMGSKALEIKLGNTRAYAESGDTLLSDVEISLMEEVNRQVQPIKKKAESLLSSLDSVVTVVQYFIKKDKMENLSRSIVSIRNTFKSLESATSNLDTLMITQKDRMSRILANIESITSNLDENQDNLNNILSNFSNISDTLAQAKITETLLSTNEAMSAISTIVNRINEGEGSLGLLVNDDSLYYNLDRSAEELNKLLEDIRKNPKRYVKFSIW